MITAGSLDKPVLWGPAVEQAESDAWPAPGRLSFIRSFFYYHDRLEDLIFPLSQCNFWFVSSAPLYWRCYEAKGNRVY